MRNLELSKSNDRKGKSDCQGLGEEKMKTYWLTGTEFYFHKMKSYVDR